MFNLRSFRFCGVKDSSSLGLVESRTHLWSGLVESVTSHQSVLVESETHHSSGLVESSTHDRSGLVKSRTPHHKDLEKLTTTLVFWSHGLLITPWVIHICH